MRAGPTLIALAIAAVAVNGASGEEFYNFDAVTALAGGALEGQNVIWPVPGFELLLLRNGHVVYDQAFGEWTVGQVAAADSATKTMSGALILSLADESPNPFSLDTPLSRYIPEFSGVKSAITIRQSFAHMAGMRGSSAIGDPTVTLYEAALDIADDPLAYVPGTTFSYGGTSMHAAGAVAELAGGMSWNGLFADRITGPLGLTRTRFALTAPSNPRVAGGVESTAAEFARFMEMLRRGGEIDGRRVLSSEAVVEMFTKQTPVDVPIASSPLDSADYGVGVWLDERGDQGELLGAMAAGARGFSSWVDFDDGVVGALATDLTLSRNIRELVYLIRAEVARAVRSPVLGGDANLDGAVTDADYTIWADHHGATGATWSMGDFSGDGAVTEADYTIWADNYGAAAGVVPEPTGLGLIVLSGLVALCRRRASEHTRAASSKTTP